jgi:hypothetical protein
MYVPIVCLIKNMGSGGSIGRARLWRCLGYKFKSYLEQFIRIRMYIIYIKVVVELVDMDSLGLSDSSILSVQVGFTLICL